MKFRFLISSCLRVGIIFASSIAVGSVVAASSDFDDDGMINHDYKARKWKEQNVVIPALPSKKNLVPLQFPDAQRKYYIDIKSVSVGKKDRVTRYTVMIVSNSGVSNVFYEGIRCHDKDFKTYAYSVSGQAFRKMNNPQWRTISETGIAKYRKVLLDFYLCQGAAPRHKAKDIIQVLKYPPDNHAPEANE